MLFPNNAQLLYIAMADAYAMATEYIKRPRDEATHLAALEFERYVAHPTHTDHKASHYTDDAEMSCANAQVLIRCGHEAIPLDFANAYVAEFARGGRRTGYSRGFQSILERVTSGAELVSVLRPDSKKNGAAMRAVPLGVLRDPATCVRLATMQARITHDTPEGRLSARAVALMSHYALYEPGPLSDLPAFCLDCLPKEDTQRFGDVFRRLWNAGPVTSTATHSVGVTTVHAVVTLLAREKSLMAMLEQVIRWGGDTDSVAAIAWGIASARMQDERLPDFLERDLESGSPHTGAAYLRALGTQLMAAHA